MSAKDQIINFINDLFAIILVGFCIIYFTAGDRFEAFGILMKSLLPLVIFSIIFLIRLRLNRRQLNKIKRENNHEIILRLTYFDKLKLDIIIYSLPIIILGIALIINKEINTTDIIQAIVVFLIAYFCQQMLFKKED